MRDIIEQLDGLSPDMLLGVIHAFEIQQPEVAITKKDALIEHYGFRADDLTYFDEHINEEEHIAFGQAISKVYSNQDDFNKGFIHGSKLLYDALDRYLENGNN
jgi:pyrroloquinoline quinone (PQQ) biosynthesis protein C